MLVRLTRCDQHFLCLISDKFDGSVAMFRYWSYWDFVDVNGENFDSWNEFYGPHLYNGDNFTTNMRYNVS
jgi:hypothetical protein